MTAPAVDQDLDRLRLRTGLTDAEVRSLRRFERVAIANLHTTLSGDDNGVEWLPAAVRQLSPLARLRLAEDPELLALWCERERRRVAAGAAYFTRGYGHVRSPEPGPALPFDLWPEQEAVMDLLDERDKLVVLKARQLGLTWVGLHYAVWLMTHAPGALSAVVLALSQNGDYAKALLTRGRGIHERLPAFLRFEEDPATRSSKSEWRLQGRGYMRSLAGTPSAPRSLQATFALCDEWAFVRNGQAGPTMTALMPACRRIMCISTGNGGPEEKRDGNKPTDGQSFAQLYVEAREGQRADWTAVFLPDSVHPERTPEWRELERKAYDTEEDFLTEHPEDDDEALSGGHRDRFFKLGDIAAAVRLGEQLDATLGTDDMTPPVGGLLDLGIDWGEHSAFVPVWPLEGGGIYVPPGAMLVKGAEIGDFTERVHDQVRKLERRARHPELLPALRIGMENFDAAGKQSNLTFTATARQPHLARQWNGGEPRPHKVAFGSHKQAVGNYLRRLFTRIGRGETVQVIAISPENAELIRQLRGLQSDGKGTWEKEDDHLPDSLIAGAQPIARRHRQARTTRQ